jgi:GTP-binding protein
VSRGPPDGGDGGPGGDVIIRATHQTSSLHHIRHIYTGGNGKTGSSGKKTGKRGADLILEVPPGTVIRPYEPNQPKGADEAEEVDAMEDLSVDQYQPEPTALSHLHDDEESPENGDEVVADEEGNAEYEEDAEQKPQIKPTVAPANDPVVDQAARAVMMSTAKASNNLKRTSRQKLVERMVQSYEYQVAKAAEPHIEPITASSVAATAPAHILKKNGLEVKGLVVDLDKEGAFFVAARGGAGGLGNWRLGAERKRPQSTALPGKPGTEGWFILELKLLADVGLVGFPNAGKSSFLAAVSRATPTVGSYPFTTLSPQIGSVSFPDHEQITIADLPGLIDGAHTNRGLGHEFLRHVERTNTLVYVLDITGSVMDRRALKVVDPFYTLITLRDELDKYLPGLSSRVVGIVANKMDLPGAKEGLAKLRNRIAQSKDKNLGKLPIWPISAQNKEGLDPVIRTMRAAVKGELSSGYGSFGQ